MDDIYETTNIKPEATIPKEPKDRKVTFRFVVDAGEPRTEEVVATPAVGGFLARSAGFVAPNVPDAKPSYEMRCEVLADGTLQKTEEYRVWPLNGTVEAVTADGACTDFRFSVSQSGATADDVIVTANAGTSDPFRLAKAPFEIVSRGPYTIVSTEVVGRKRKVKVARSVEFVAPAQSPRQYVNLDTASNGQDANGSKVRCEIRPMGIAGDPGAFAYVEVEFSHAAGATARSERNLPKAGLLTTSTSVRDLDASNPLLQKAKVYFDQAGLGVFEVELGAAGGDKCTVKIGCTPACSDATRTFENWRKVYYEVMVPTFLGLGGLPGGAMPRIDAARDAIFVEYTPEPVIQVDDGALPANAKLPRTFLNLKSGPPERYSLTFTGFTKACGNFVNAKAPRQACVHLCDWTWKPIIAQPASMSTIRRVINVTTTTRLKPVPVPQGAYWLPSEPLVNGLSPDNIEIHWKAQVTKDRARVSPTLVIDDADKVEDESIKNRRTIELSDFHDPTNTATLVFEKGFLDFNIPTSVSATANGLIDGFLRAATSDYRALKARNNEVRVVVTAPKGNDHRRNRLAAVKTALATRLTALGVGVSTHPGVDDDGDPAEGDLGIAGVDMAESRAWQIAVLLPNATPTDPGSFAGALSDTHCPIALTVKFVPYSFLGGFAKPNSPYVVVSLDWDKPELVGNIFLHEVAHKMAMTAHTNGAFAPGLAVPASVTGDAIPRYRHGGDRGHAYDGKNHQGPHCAYGLSDTDKGVGDYQTVKDKAKCIMFGGVTDSATSFCPQCVDYLRARLLDEVHSG